MKPLSLLFWFWIGLLPRLAAQDIYDPNAITEIKIYFAEKNWDTILDSLKQSGDSERLVGDVVINGKKYFKAGIRYKGNSSYKNPRKSGYVKLPFNIKINETDKKQMLPGGYTTLKLSNAFRDPSFLRELLSYEIAGYYMPAPKANFAKVYVNDRYLGVYHNVQSVDNRFLEAYYGHSSGELIKCDPDWEMPQAPGCPDSDKSSLMYIGEDSTCYMRFYELKDKTGWRNLVQLTKVLNHEPDKLETILDVDQALWMLAFNNVLVNLDSYTGMLCHNYYLYRDSFGVFHPIVWDMNLSLGGFRRLLASGQLTDEEMQNLSPFVHYKENNPKRPLIVKLLANELYRKIYMGHIKTLLDEQFVSGTYSKRARALQAFIDKHVKADEAKLYSYEAFRLNIDSSTMANSERIIGITELMEKRTAYLLTHPAFQKSPPAIANVNHRIAGNQIVVSVKLEEAQRSWLYYRYGKGSNFTRVPMTDDGKNGDKTANDGVWSAQIEQREGAQYYIVAEGERIATLSPARASREFYTVESPAANTSKAK